MLRNCLIINLRDFGENSLLVSVLHPELGRQSFIAKGAKRIGAKLTPWLEPLSLLDLWLAPTKGELATIREVELIKSYLPSRYLPLKLSLHIIHFLDRATYPSLECKAFMQGVLAILEVVSRPSVSLEDLKKLWIQFELLLLSYLGAAPEQKHIWAGNVDHIARLLEQKILQLLLP